MTEVCAEPRRGSWFHGSLKEAWAVPPGPRGLLDLLPCPQDSSLALSSLVPRSSEIPLLRALSNPTLDSTIRFS